MNLCQMSKTINMKDNYSLHYYISWPECQEYEDMPGFQENSTFNTFEYGYFVDKEWFDSIED